MNSEEFETLALPIPQKRSFWQRLGGGSLTISLIFHGVLLAVGGLWIYQVVQPEKKPVKFIAQSGGGGSPSSESKSKQYRVQMMQPNMARVAAVGATSTLTLPEPDQMSDMTSLGSMSMGGLSGGGLGGNGGGGGRGDGKGLGAGNGLAPGMGTGAAGLKNPFGVMEANSGGLTGIFYDFKQTKDLKATDITDDGVREELKAIAERGFRSRAFNKYFRAPRVLYQTKFMIPLMPADKAPAAFEVDQYVQPKRWFVVYQGAVKAPKSGKFRFVGAGDDLLLVRFNHRLVFDYGYTIGCTGGGSHATSPENYAKDKNSDAIRNFERVSPMPVPNINYRYSTTPRINNDIGGVAVGPVFSVDAGATYPIEIVISEIPGGIFSTILLIQEEGVEYAKDPAGYPILPLFRLDDSLPSGTDEETPPFDPTGPIWPFVPGGAKIEI